MRASVPDLLRENIDWLERLLEVHRKDWNKRHPERYMQVVMDGDEVSQLIDDLRDVLARVEEEPS